MTDFNWQTARPTCRVTRPFPKDWDERYLTPFAPGIPKNESLPCSLTLFQLDAGVQVVPSDPRFTAHHCVKRDGNRWWCDGVEVIEEPDAPSLPMPPDVDAVTVADEGAPT